ncbi:hypothetical protein HIM_05177 [Hirsutella minnesotensis 3608]|uniref:Uncharacterized protein n=1 Tax=Hirsutella minnesotensis 3608 TaxID=1043627 RepID=A0A0F7ZKP6_9HYPO|nr:hypothetical protein HIM_05177 [Hirsutella minnesotensis 3608]
MLVPQDGNGDPRPAGGGPVRNRPNHLLNGRPDNIAAQGSNMPRRVGVVYVRPDGSGRVVVGNDVGTPFARYTDYQAHPNGADVGEDPMNLAGDKHDKFQVQDIQLRPQGASPGLKVSNDKYVSLNTWYGHSNSWSLPLTSDKETVATLDIAPGDWRMDPPCAVVKDLVYEFKLADQNWAGTSNAMFFSLDSGNLRKLAPHDEYGANGSNHDEWLFQGITFTATCADGPKTMEMRKFESENRWIGHDESQPDRWTGDFDVEDWRAVA